MSDHAFNICQGLWFQLHAVIDDTLENESIETREYVIEKLSDEFRFSDHNAIHDGEDLMK